MRADYKRSDFGKLERGKFLKEVAKGTSVVGGVIALMKAIKPDLSPPQCKEILRETASPLTFEGETAPRALDAGAAARGVRL